ncbi:MAG: hypothetical protein JW885_14835 [Deltaproteobacteria bacterium]|nr:hypothetical protein [Candidatus Zymogenaceae bacterium]
MVISFKKAHLEDDKTLLTDRQRFVCMFFEDICHIKKTAANLAESGNKAGISEEILEKLREIICISEEISKSAAEKMSGIIPRSSADSNDWS